MKYTNHTKVQEKYNKTIKKWRDTVKRVEVHNFQNLTMENAIVMSIPLKEAKAEEADLFSVVFVRDPYAYFDALLFDYLTHKRSLLFTQDIINNMKKFDNETFLQWFKTLNFIPFYNPQTFQLDSKKRTATALENLESFDYVVPYEEIDIFLKNVSPDITISRGKEEKLLFSFSSQRENVLTEEFIGKDMELYERSVELWELVKKNNFKPLRSLISRKKAAEKTHSAQKLEEMQKYTKTVLGCM